MAGSRPGSAASNTGSVLLLNTADVDDELVVEDLDVEEEEVVLGSGSVESVTGNSGQEVKGSGEMKNSQSEFDGTTDAQGSEGDADGLKGRTFQNKISMMTADGRLPGVGGEDDDESKDGDDGNGLKSEDTSVRGKGATNLVDLIKFVSDIDADKEWREKPGLEDPRKHSKSFGDQTLKAKMRRWVYSTEVQGFVVAVICVDVMFLLVGYLDFALVSAPAQKYLAYAVTGIMSVDTCLRIGVDGFGEFFNVRKDPFKTTDAVLLAVCILFEIATLPALSAAARSFRLSRIIRIFSRLVRFVATLRRIKGTKDDGSGLTALDALRWTATWTTAHTPWMMVKCVLWLLAQCVHPVLEPLLVRYLFDVALAGIHRLQLRRSYPDLSGLLDSLNAMRVYLGVFDGNTGTVDLKLAAYANLVLVFSSLVYSQMKYRVKIDSPSGGICIALLQSQIADKFSRMPVEWIDAVNKDYVASMLLRDTRIIDMNIDALMELVRLVLYFGVYMAVLFMLSWRMALVLVVFLPISFAYNSEKANKLMEKIDVRDRALVEFDENTHEQITLTFARVRMGLKHDTSARINASQLIDEYAEVEEVEGEQARGTSMVFLVHRALILTIGSQFLARNILTLGSYVAFILASQVNEKIVSQSAAQFVQLNRSRLPLRRYLDLLGREESEKMKSRESNLDTNQSSDTGDMRRKHKSAFLIRAQDCEFNYSEGPFGVPIGRKVTPLFNINVDVAQGSMVVLMGTSGSGKNTLLKVLAGIYTASRGSVFIAGHDINSIASVHRLLSYLPNEVMMVEGSISRNMRLAHEDAQDSAVALVCMQLELGGDQFANGLDSDVRLLDPARRQRLGLGRALLLKRPLLFMEQPTSNQSAKMANKIVSHLRFLRVPSADGGSVKATTLLSSNNVNVVKQSDSVIFVKDGSIVESGLYDDLMEKRGHVFKSVRKVAGLEQDPHGLYSMKPDFLRRLWIFSGLTPEDASEVCALFTAQHYASKEVLFNGTQSVTSLYVHVSGVVAEYPAAPEKVPGDASSSAVRDSGSGDEDGDVSRASESWTPGHMCGAQYLLSRAPHWASSAVARSEVSVLHLDRDAFHLLCERNAAVHEAVRSMHAALASITSPSRLALIWIFAAVPFASLVALAERFTVDRLEAGVTVFSQGDERSRGMTVVVDGALAVRRASPELRSGARKQWIQILRSGCHVASELLANAAREDLGEEGHPPVGVDALNGARAVRPTVVAQLGVMDFKKWLDADRAAATAVRETLAARAEALAPSSLRLCWCFARFGSRGLAMLAACFTPFTVSEGETLFPRVADRAFIVLMGELVAERELVHRDGSATVVCELWSARTKPKTVLNDAALSRFARGASQTSRGDGRESRDAESLLQVTAKSPCVLLTLSGSAYKTVVRRESDRLWAARPRPPPDIVPNVWTNPVKVANSKAALAQHPELRKISSLYERVAGDVHDRGNYTVGPPPWDPPEPGESRPTLLQESALRARMRTVAMYKGDVLESPACFVAVVLHGELWAHVGGPAADERSYQIIKRTQQAVTGSVRRYTEGNADAASVNAHTDAQAEAEAEAAAALSFPPVIMSSAAERALEPQGRLPGTVVVSARVFSPMALLVVYDVESVINRSGILDAFAKEQESLRACLRDIEKARRRIRRATAVNIKLSVLLGMRQPLEAKRLWKAAYHEAKMYRLRTQNSVFVEEVHATLLGDASWFSATESSLKADERSLRAAVMSRHARLKALLKQAKELDHVPLQPGEAPEETTHENAVAKVVEVALTADATQLAAHRLEGLRGVIERCKEERAARLARQIATIEEVIAELRMSAMTKAEEEAADAARRSGGRGDSAGSVGRGEINGGGDGGGGGSGRGGGGGGGIDGSHITPPPRPGRGQSKKSGVLVEVDDAGAAGHGERLSTLLAAESELAIIKSSEPTAISFRLARTCLGRLQALYERPLSDLQEELRELWRELGVPKTQPDRRALEQKQFEPASLAMVREHTVAVALLRSARRQMLSLANGREDLVPDDVRVAMRLRADADAADAAADADADATLAFNALMSRDRHVVRVLLTEAEKGSGMEQMMEKLRDHRGLGPDAVRRLLEVAMDSQTEMNRLVVHRAELMTRLRDSWAVLETPEEAREATAMLVVDARGAGLRAAAEMTARLEREAKLARRTRDRMVVMLAEKWRLLGTDARDIRVQSHRAFGGAADKIRRNSLAVYSELLREQRARREAADVALGGAHTSEALRFFKDVVAYVEALGGDLLTTWNVLREFHGNRRFARKQASLPVLGAFAAPGAPCDASPATAETVPLRALASLVSTKVHVPESISSFGLACYVADGVMTYEGFQRGMHRCQMVEDGWKELDAEEASMSAALRSNIRESVTRAWTRLDRARAVLDGIDSVDLARQRLASDPPPLAVHVLGAVACILRADDADEAGAVELVEEHTSHGDAPVDDEDGDDDDASGGAAIMRGGGVDDAELEDESRRELRAEWAVVQRMLANPRVMMRLRSLNPSSVPVDVLCELRRRLREYDDVWQAAQIFASQIRNVEDYQLITAGGGDDAQRLFEPLAYYAVCLETAATLDKIWMRRQLIIDAGRIVEEQEANPELNPLALPKAVKALRRTMTFVRMSTRDGSPTRDERDASATKPKGLGGFFRGLFGGKVAPTPSSPPPPVKSVAVDARVGFHPVAAAAEPPTPRPRMVPSPASREKSNLEKSVEPARRGRSVDGGEVGGGGFVKRSREKSFHGVLGMKRRSERSGNVKTMTMRNLNLGTGDFDSDDLHAVADGKK